MIENLVWKAGKRGASEVIAGRDLRGMKPTSPSGA